MPKAPNTKPGPLTKALADVLVRYQGRMTDSHLANIAGVDRTATGKILKGTKVPDIEVLERLAMALGQTLTSVSKEAEAAVEGVRFEAQK